MTGHDPIGGSQNPLAARLERGLVLGQRVHFRRAIGVPLGVDTGHHAVGGLDNHAQVLAGMTRVSLSQTLGLVSKIEQRAPLDRAA